VQTEGTLMYRQNQVAICVIICQFHRLYSLRIVHLAVHVK